MSAPLLVKRVTFTVTKERKLHGILTVTGSQIQWSPHDPTESQPHHVDIKDVTGTNRAQLLCLAHRVALLWHFGTRQLTACMNPVCQ